jgi:hypothetical protein
MFPFSFEWIWDAGHMVFHGGLWYALTILGLGMTYCIIKAAAALFCFDYADAIIIFAFFLSTGFAPRRTRSSRRVLRLIKNYFSLCSLCLCGYQNEVSGLTR